MAVFLRQFRPCLLGPPPAINLYITCCYADQLMHKSFETRASIRGQGALDSRGKGKAGIFSVSPSPQNVMVKFSRIGHFQGVGTC